jgi:pimeloyl-ACP methyl ester carboxylesterase
MSHLSRTPASICQGVILAVLAILPSVTRAQVATPVKNIVLVHGAFADATSWSKVIPLLESDGYSVVAVQNPLISFSQEVAAVKRMIALQDGPVLLVAHSWGGAVITQAGDDPKVVGLVYISAYAPDAGQSANEQSSRYGWTEGQKQIRIDNEKFASMTFKGVSEDIAQRLPRAEQQLFFATQGQTYGPMFDEKLTAAAWQRKPSWVLIASNDRMLPPAMERAEVDRLRAIGSLTLPTGHMALLEEPEKVAGFISAAAKGASPK